jgi:hypothetical protein
MAGRSKRFAYETSDLYLAAYLKIRTKFVGMEPDSKGPRQVFMFEADSKERFDELKMAWVTGTDLVPPQEYANAVRDLKNLVHLK